jgi:hypothetical protein
VRAAVGPYVVDREAVALEAEAYFRHPRFDEAVARYAAAGTEPLSGGPRSAKLICHVARYTLAVAVFHLDATGGPNGTGATASNLRLMLTTGQYASDGWVKNAVRVFARAGYFDRYPASHDRRAIRVVPSNKMIHVAQEAIAPKLAVIGLLSPLPLPAEDLARYPGFVAAMATHTIVPYLTDGFTELEGFPEIRELVRHDYGYVVYCVIVGSMRREPDGAIVAKVPSLSLSRRFGMSRNQSRNILESCRAAGQIVSIGRGGHQVTLSPEFAELCRRYVAFDIACWNRMVRAAAADVGLPVQPPGAFGP